MGCICCSQPVIYKIDLRAGMYKHKFPAFKVFKCSFSVARWLWQVEGTSCMIVAVEHLHVHAHIRTHKRTELVGCSWLITYEKKINLFVLSW